MTDYIWNLKPEKVKHLTFPPDPPQPTGRMDPPPKFRKGTDAIASKDGRVEQPLSKRVPKFCGQCQRMTNELRSDTGCASCDEWLTAPKLTTEGERIILHSEENELDTGSTAWFIIPHTGQSFVCEVIKHGKFSSKIRFQYEKEWKEAKTPNQDLFLYDPVKVMPDPQTVHLSPREILWFTNFFRGKETSADIPDTIDEAEAIQLMESGPIE